MNPGETTANKGLLGMRRFRLRTLLLAVAIIAIALTPLGSKVHRARQQRKAVEALLEAGGRIHYDYSMNDSYDRVKGGVPPVPGWLVRWFGQDLFCNVHTVDLSQRAISARELKQLEKLPNVKVVGLNATATGDKDLEIISRLRTIEVLFLSETQVSDAGLVHLRTLPGLRRLQLVRTGITDEGIAHLRESSQLERLALMGTTGVSKQSFVHFRAMPNLKQLEIQSTSVTAAEAKDLQSRMPDTIVVH